MELPSAATSLASRLQSQLTDRTATVGVVAVSYTHLTLPTIYSV